MVIARFETMYPTNAGSGQETRLSTRTTTPLEQAGFFYMDVVRAIAASVVVLAHVHDLTFVDYAELVDPGVLLKALYFISDFGHQAVMVFFALSGFWITGSVVRRADRESFWTDYLIDRVSRLAVVLVPALLLGGALDIIGTSLLQSPLYAGTSGANGLRVAVTDRLTPHSFLANLVFLQAIAAPTFGTNGPLWSLAYEFWYYIWFPAIFLLIRGRMSLALAALGLALVAADLAINFAAWLCGTGLFFAFEHVKRSGSLGSRRLGWLLISAGGAVLGTSLFYGRLFGATAVLDILVAASFSIALLGVCVLGPGRASWLVRIATYGARSSFSLYLFHYPIAAFVLALALPSGRVLPDASSMLLAAGTFVGLIAAGAVLSSLTERHTHRVRTLVRQRLLGTTSATG